MGALTLSGGTLLKATVIVTNGASLVVPSSGTLDGVTVEGLLESVSGPRAAEPLAEAVGQQGGFGGPAIVFEPST